MADSDASDASSASSTSLSELRTHAKAGVRKVREKLRLQRDRLIRKFKPQLEVTLLDKMSFTLGVITLMVTEFVALMHPAWFPLYYTVITVPLMILRYFSYHRQKFHYFMLDFCYFGQALAMIHIWVLPNSASFARLVFLFSNGPILWAIIAWRNSLVFHSLDKTTSLAMHVLPGVLTFCTRWHPGSHISTGCEDGVCGASPQEDLAYGLMWYAVWQVLYTIKVDVLDGKKLQQDAALETSLRWMLRYRKDGLFGAMLQPFRWLGIVKPNEILHETSWKARTAFMLSQLAFTLLTMIPAVLCLHSYRLHVAVLLINLGFSVWNGAGYYIEVFSKQYVAHVQAVMAEKQQQQQQQKAKVAA